MTITQRFLDSIWDFSVRPVTEKEIGLVRNCLIDYAACTTLGASLLKEENESYLNTFGNSAGNISVVGSHVRTNVLCAGMLNGINSHMIELDDGHRYAMLHLGAPVFSAMLAVAQDQKLGADQFVRGVLVGYEATVRLATAVQPGHKLKGYHATGTCGTIGTALGLATAMGLPKECWNTVISAAATDAAGLLQVIDDGSELKPYNVGRAVTAAINAAYMGRTGLKGPSDVLGGGRGFFKTMAAEVKEDYLLNGFMPDYAIERIYRKPYAACRHCHSAIEAALNIRRDHTPSPEEIDRILVDTYGLAVKGHEHTVVQGAGSAKMSIPYAVASALLFGKVNYQQYEPDCLEDERLDALMKKVEVREDKDLSVLVPAKRVAIVTVNAGEDSYCDQVDYPLGEPENPMSQEMLEEKFYSLMSAAGTGREQAEEILSRIYDLERSLGELLSLL